MSKLFSDFYGLLLSELPGCNLPLVDLNLREVAREFCKSSSAWRSNLAPISLVSGQAAYALTSPDITGSIHRVTRVKSNGVLLWTYRGFIGEYPKYAIDAPPFTLSGDLLTLTFSEDEIPGSSLADGLLIEVALQPKTDAMELPDFLHTLHSEALRKGTLSRLMLMPAKEWSSPALSVVYGQDYKSLLAFATNEAQTGNTRQALRVKKWG